jgi:hypothetical protein
MIPIRLPWRPRARPSATLHEILSLLSEERTCEKCYNRPSGLSRGYVAPATAAVKRYIWLYFFAAASSFRSAAMVSAEESLRLVFLGRRFVLLE